MKKDVVIATHVFSPGTSQALRDYLEDKVRVTFIGHPLSGNAFSWAAGFFDTIARVVRGGRRFDLFVGSNNLNSLAGLALRAMKRVRKVIFYTPDSPPVRFKNPLLNHVYYWVDYYCVRHCDQVWNNSPAMVEIRERRGVPSLYRSKQKTVLMGTHPHPEVPFDQIDRFAVGFVGHLKPGMGLELLLDAFRDVQRRLPPARLLIIGSGPVEDALKARAAGLTVEFTGLIDDLSRVYEKLSRCALAVAPYEPGSVSQYTDPGKVKNYLSVGLPVVITRVPQIAFEIEKEGCGLAVDFDQKQLADAITTLLTDEARLRSSRDRARRLAQAYSWDTIFSEALAGWL